MKIPLKLKELRKSFSHQFCLDVTEFGQSACPFFGRGRSKEKLTDAGHQTQDDRRQMQCNGISSQANMEKKMASSNFDQDNVVRCKMNRRDIALVFIAVLVLIQGAVTVYIIVSNKQTSNGELQTKLQMQQDEIEKQKDKLTSIYSELEKAKTNQGVVYVRWGRKDCPGNGTETVYSGYAGGSYYDHTGAAVDYVCLPPDPSWGPKTNIRSYAPGYMYGAEYEDEVLFNDKNREVPCAVCRSSNQSTSIMIPARTTCYTGWDEAYHGYLASGYHNHPAASQYVCVDENPQALIGGGSSDDNGILFYQVRTKCGSLKCPPYEDDKVLSCVVCMK